MKRTLVSIVSMLVLAPCLLGCGPSEQEKQECAAKKAAARDAWGSYAKALRAESDRIGAKLVERASAAKVLAVQEGLAGQDADAAQKAAQRTKAAARIAEADAFRAYQRAVDTAAGAAEAILAAWDGPVFAAVEAEASSASQLDGVAPTAERLGAVGSESEASAASRFPGLRSTAASAGVAALGACQALERE